MTSDKAKIQFWQHAYNRMTNDYDLAKERIAELESILRDIVADADDIRIDSYIPTVNWTSINKAKRLLKITPLDK